MSNVEFTSNLGTARNATEDAIRRALEIIGGMAETNVKAITPVDTGNLRRSMARDWTSALAYTTARRSPGC